MAGLVAMSGSYLSKEISMDVYVWYNALNDRYEIGSRVDFEMIMSRKTFHEKPELLYRFNRLSSRLAYKVVEELNEESNMKSV